MVNNKKGIDLPILSSYLFCYEWLINNYQEKQLLDYGCGNGRHAINLAKREIDVIGIDLSEESLKIARESLGWEGVEKRVDFRVMDCENMTFPNQYFDAVFDGGTFSSLDINKALPEIARVLKSDGCLIGIETFGHNPLTNLVRKINRLRGVRTDWAVKHIMTEERLELLEKYFQKVTVYYFHPFSWVVFPLLGLPIGQSLLRFLEGGEKQLLRFHFFKDIPSRWYLSPKGQLYD